MGCMSKTLILVEGESDKAALLAVAARMQNPDQLSVVAMGGITNIARFIGDAVAREVPFAGLYDADAEGHVTSALRRAGLVDANLAADLEAFGFFRCDPDLEAEMIAALGVGRVLDVVSGQGEDMRRFLKLRQMPEWRGRSTEDQLVRWFGSGGGRKVRYAKLLGDAMSAESVPAPLRRVLAFGNGVG